MGLTDKLIYSMFIYQKTVDRSTLRQGFQIPVEYHALLAAMPGGMLSQGETRNIKVWMPLQVWPYLPRIPHRGLLEPVNNANLK